MAVVCVLSGLPSAASPKALAQSVAECGDVNSDTRVDIADPIYLLRYNLLGGAPPRCESMYKCADVNKDSRIDIGDPIFLIGYLLLGSELAPSCTGFEGCTDELAVNYDATAEIDDGSCQYGGCIDPGADNYDENADVDDGSCFYSHIPISGFTYIDHNLQGHAEYEHRGTGVVFVYLPAGAGRVGSHRDECERNDDEGPAHAVHLSPFLIAKYEISQREWRDVMLENPSYFRVGGEGEGFIGDELSTAQAYLELPVENVSWDECTEYCSRTGLELPTEAQWEFACRAGTVTAFTFGDTISADQANFWASTGYCNGETGMELGRTALIDAYTPNAFGLHNMHGNVWEWCRDEYSETAYPTLEGGAVDPLVENGSGQRILRGGGWFGLPRYCRSSNRSSLDPAVKSLQIGFRPVLTLKP